jgi:hypothetical protein
MFNDGAFSGPQAASIVVSSSVIAGQNNPNCGGHQHPARRDVL